MSEENVQLMRSMYRPGDPGRFFELLHERVHVDVSKAPLLPDHPVLIGGREAALDLYRHYWGTWDEYILQTVEIIDAGQDRVLRIQAERGRGGGSGGPFDGGWAVLSPVREGKIVRIEHFDEPRAALEAAGLSE